MTTDHGQRPIRVLHLIDGLGAGGAERLLRTTLAQLDRDAFPGLVCHLFPDDRWAGPVRDAGVPVHSLGLRHFWQPGRALGRLRRLLRDEQIDLVHAHLYGAGVYGRLVGAWLGVPTVTTVHNVDYDLPPDPAVRCGRAKRWIYRSVDRLSCRPGRPRFVAVSEHVRGYAVRQLGVPAERVEVLLNWVDPAGLGADPAGSRAAIRAELGIPAGAPVLLTVGRLDPQKGHGCLVRALARVHAAFPEARALVVGPGSGAAREALLREARAHGVEGSVHLPGVREDVGALLECCDLFVFPSRTEGFGLALAEAMWAGRACVATTAAALPELVTHERTGLLVPPDEPAALAAAVIRLLRDPGLRTALGGAARLEARRRFDPGRGVAGLEALYRAAIAEHARGSVARGAVVGAAPLRPGGRA